MWHLDRMQSGKVKRNEKNVSWYENYLGTFYMCPAWHIQKEVFLTKDLLQRALEDSNPRPFGP